MQITLNYNLYKYPSWESCYDAIKLLIELFDLLICMVWGWCIDLNDCDLVWPCWDSDGDEPVGDGSAADDTTNNWWNHKQKLEKYNFPMLSHDLVIASYDTGSGVMNR